MPLTKTAPDQDGVVLDVLVQSRRDAGAAKRFFKRLLKGLRYMPRVVVTDKLGSYGVAKRELLPDVQVVTAGAVPKHRHNDIVLSRSQPKPGHDRLS